MAIQALLVALPLLLVPQEDPRATPVGAAMDRLVGGLSRDAKVLFFTPDCAATLRRIRRVPVMDVVGRLASEELQAQAAEYASHLSLFVPPPILSSAPALFARIQGGLALSVEGFVVDRGVARPDVLLIADDAGVADVVPALIALARSDADGAARIRAADLPFELSDRRPRVGVSDGVLIVELTTRSGVDLALAQSGGRLIAARSAERVAIALARLAAPSGASILGSDRFKEAMLAVTPRPGDVVWYADLRRLRREEAFVMAPEGPVRALFVDHLRDMDGLAVAIRGVGETFHGRAFLERGRWASREAGPGIAGLFSTESVFSFPARITAPVSAAMALRADPLLTARIAGQIAGAFLRTGTTDQALESVLKPLGGEAYLRSLSRHLGPEAVFFQPEGAFAGESLVRIGMAVEVRDDHAVSAWFEKLVTAGTARSIDLRGTRAWEVRLADGSQVLPVFALHQGWLVGANHVFALRRIIDRSSSAPLASSDAFHAPFDRLDRAALSPGIVSGYIDTAQIAQAFATWMSGAQSMMWLTALSEDAWEWLDEIRELVDDPELQDSLRGMAWHGRRVASGFLLEWVGP